MHLQHKMRGVNSRESAVMRVRPQRPPLACAQAAPARSECAFTRCSFFHSFAQAHRKVLGLLTFGQSDSPDDLTDLHAAYDDVRQQFRLAQIFFAKYHNC